ncbi:MULTISPECIES: hypothetical protein [unclassified Streptomyces]|uniref:hypothetical protein n=1 Tax=unclassified Streptomyces TaxID=2593676 RepID=UPI00380EA44F
MTDPPTLTQQPQSGPQPPRKRRFPTKRWVIGAVGMVCRGLTAGLVMDHYEIPPFTCKGDSISPFFSPSRARPGRQRRLVCLSVVGVGLALLAGCGTSHVAVSAGQVRPASAPLQLWPDQGPRASPPPALVDSPPADPQPDPGFPPVPSGNLHDADSLAVVQRAVATSHPEVGPEALDAHTVQAVSACRTIGVAPCPVLSPVYRDVTGDGTDELILGIPMEDPQFLSLRVYGLKGTRVVSLLAAPVSNGDITIAGHQLVVTSPVESGYQRRETYTYDRTTQQMVISSTDYRTQSPSSGPRNGTSGPRKDAR